MQAAGECDAAEATIKGAGFDPRHFTINVKREADDAGVAIYPFRYALMITNKGSGLTATLAGGYGENWLGDLKAELRSGEFGNP
jgi:hypothetical protein